MKWNYTTATLSFNERDISVINQCGICIDEIMEKKAASLFIPPLWSVLSYELLRSQAGFPNGFWREYRQSIALAENRDEHYLPAYYQKNTKGLRKLSIPDWFISNHQQFMLREIFNFLPVSDCAFAYRKGRSIKACAEPHLKHETLIHLDLKDFFHSIKEQTVFESLLRETGYSKQLVNFMSRLCCHEGSLPQGACTSPVLSNICFRPCDDKLLNYARSHCLTYTRYSDDLFFSGAVKDAGEIIQALTAIIESFGCTVNREKTKVLRRNCAQRIVGIVVNEKLQVSRSYRRALRQELYYLHKYHEDARGAKESKSYLHYLYQLKGKIAFVLSIDPENAEFLLERERLLELIFKHETRHTEEYPIMEELPF